MELDCGICREKHWVYFDGGFLETKYKEGRTSQAQNEVRDETFNKWQSRYEV